LVRYYFANPLRPIRLGPPPGNLVTSRQID
jgi:hypothetical protein